MFKKCKQCSKLIFFRSKLYREDYYCGKCVKIVQDKDIEIENEFTDVEEQPRDKWREALLRFTVVINGEEF